VSSREIDAHLRKIPEPQRSTLVALRALLRELLPEAEECIKYSMPCFALNGKGVATFDGFKNHCSYFPMSGGVLEGISGLPSWCVTSKGTLQFPVDRPLSKTLVTKLVKARLKEIETRGR
jgi:uncharacterized protein YdhG (YjbR/CyaY superfamily)